VVGEAGAEVGHKVAEVVGADEGAGVVARGGMPRCV
jgi:hypothetical protein